MARSALLNVMVQSALKAGKSLARDFGEVQNLQVSVKGPGDFVSQADFKAEKIVRDELLKARPTYGVLGEESDEIKGTDGAHRWIVDPLDGTTNFLHGIPQFAVSIALERNGEVISGVVHDPIKNETFWAEKGLGAMMNNRRIQVAARKGLGDSVISAGIFPDTQNTVEALLKLGAGIRSYGSCCLDLCYVAAGRFDAYFEGGLKPWDKAAGALIVRESRGITTEINGGNNVVFGNGILAANATLHADILRVMNGSAVKAAAAQ